LLGRKLNRKLAGALAAAALLAIWPQGVAAQTKPEPPVTIIVKGDEPADKIQKLIEGVRKSGREAQIRIAEPASPAAEGAPKAAPRSGAPEAGLVEEALSVFRAGMHVGFAALPAIPSLLSDLREKASAPGGLTALSLLMLVLAIGLPIAIGHFVRGFIARVVPDVEIGADAPLLRRAGGAAARLAADFAALAALALTMPLFVDWLLPEPGLVREFGLTARWAVPQALMYIIGGRFLLAPGEPHRRLMPLPNAEWHFRMLCWYGGFGAFILFLIAVGSHIASDRAAVAGVFFILGTAIAILKIWWFWTGRRDFSSLVLATAADPAQPSLLRKLSAAILPGFLVATAFVIWVIGRMAAVLPDGAWWGWASGMTQILVVVLPIAAPGVSALVSATRQANGGGADEPPIVRALWVVGQRAAAGIVWLIGLGVLGRMWSGALIGQDSADLVTTLRHLMTVAAVLIGGLVVWTFLKALFDAYTPKRVSGMPGDTEDDEAGKPQSRLGTILPVIRGFVLGTVVGLTVLLALARLGLDIGPLLAGFGILGLAISFGSQALVRDIVSGIFFMAEDAFRVGEYIDTGKLKGTVEKISIRSVQLRHQSGQIHTVPFGQITSVTNASRDWATVKFPIRLDRSADIEKARKVIKKVGQDMMADPDVGPEFILPVKLQGVNDIQDAAIVVRVKFTSKPARTSYLQREALKRIYRALTEAGVPFASNAVTVRSLEERALGAAAASVSQPAAVAGGA
jgi:small-conductance mechanosensitive channel